MSKTNLPTPAGKNLRVLLVSALFMSIVAGAFVMPAMAFDPWRNCMDSCDIYYPPGLDPLHNDFCKMNCQIHYPYHRMTDPLPPCGDYPDDGPGPSWRGAGACTMNPIPV